MKHTLRQAREAMSSGSVRTRPGSRFLRGLRAPLVLLFLVLSTTVHAQTDTETCLGCHDDPELVADDGRNVGLPVERFRASVHADLECIDCHTSPGDYEDVPHYARYVSVKCADCHEEAEEAYAKSVHRLGRRRNGIGAATCVSCHGTHHILAGSDSASAVHHRNIPKLCGSCHTAEAQVTKDFVRLPIAVPNYLASVHGEGWKEGKHTAVCTDCHGTHDSRIAQDPKSHTHRHNLAETCGQCHPTIAHKYQMSIHGRALALGIEDSPTCIDCHDEHLIKRHLDPQARVSPEHRAKELCGDCHTDPELVSKYGITSGVVETYLDSYHGWAVDRGSQMAATCTDCHNVHEIRSPLDPASTVHAGNVTATCGRCHKGANESFAQSYTHAGALRAKGAHGWVRTVYLWLIAVVLGGMALHNLIVARYELARHFRRRRSEPYVIRWRHAEVIQHLALLLSFTGLAITGFALRYPHTWWVDLLGLGGHESLRANLHRTFGIILIAVALYHMLWVFVTRRGRWTLREVSLRIYDPRQALANMAFHLGLRKERPAFRKFDYTQKAEYWAVVWGTWIMALTGFVLWYPTVATRWLPAWTVRVSEVIHFYEAVLAVSAIFIWHLFYVIFMPREYPMSTTWLNGRMPASEWKEHHGGEYVEVGESGVSFPSRRRDKTRKRQPALDDSAGEPLPTDEAGDEKVLK